MPQSHDALILRKVGLRRADRWILRDIDWSVPAGTCAAILGPNGSGKSTLARIIAGHLWPTAGQCAVLGQRFGEANLPELRHSIRLVQAAGPYDVDPQLTARQVVLTGFFGTLGLYDPVTQQMTDEADRLLGQVGLSHVASQAYATMSSGERVRSLIARALATRPALMLLDEPTAGLDLLAREQVVATVQALFEKGADHPALPIKPRPVAAALWAKPDHPPRPTVILITHHVEELPPVTSRVLLLTDGRVAGNGPPGEVLRADLLSMVYKCPVEVRVAAEGRYYLSVHPAAWEGLLNGGERPA